MKKEEKNSSLATFGSLKHENSQFKVKQFPNDDDDDTLGVILKHFSIIETLKISKSNRIPIKTKVCRVVGLHSHYFSVRNRHRLSAG